jgi:ketosteroid isomerase-like protein
MSQENVDRGYQVLDAFNRRDLDAYLALVDADVEVGSRLVAMEGGYHGHDGVRRWWKTLLDAFPDFTVEIVEVRDLGDVTLAAVRNRGRGAGGDTPVEEVHWQAAWWRDKKIVRWTSHGTEAEALEAVGLSK